MWTTTISCARHRKANFLLWSGVETLTSVNGYINSRNILIYKKQLLARYYSAFSAITQCLYGRKQFKHYIVAGQVKSPDINIIEETWIKFKRHLQSSRNTIDSKDQLIAELTRFWQNLSVDYVRQLYATIPTRLQKVIKLKGNLTKY